MAGKSKKKPQKKKSAPENFEEKIKKIIFFSESKNELNRVWSVILFALGILIALMVLIPGTAGWKGIHNFLLGIFGAAVFFVPAVMIYTSVLIGLEKSSENITGRVRWGTALTLLTSAAIQIFAIGSLPGETLAENFTELFRQGTELKGGGLGSLVIAGPLLLVFGGTGAKIITLVLFFVFIMLLTGKGLIQFFDMLAKPFRYLQKELSGLRRLMLDESYGYYDEEDEERERESFHADLEAISLIDNQEVNEISEEIPQKTRKGIPDSNGFILDVPLPEDYTNSGGNDNIDPVPEFQEPVIHMPEKKPVPEKKERKKPEDVLLSKEQELENLIAKAAEKEKRSKNDIDLNFTVKRHERSAVNSEYKIPELKLLSLPDNESNSDEAKAEMHEKANKIVETFKSFGVEVSIKDIFRGPSITRYEIQPGSGVTVKKIKSLEDDIALSLAAQGVRFEAPVPGKAAVGIEVPNINKDLVTLREILESPEFQNTSGKLAFAVGKNITGNAIVGDIDKMPHVIIAGTTGSGKSVCTRSIIMSILYNASPEDVKMILIDPKMVEFKVFEGIPHLLIPIVIDPKKAAGALNWAVNEMMRRYQTFADVGANDLKSYNEIAESDSEMSKFPQIVVFIDELADMMLVAKNEVENYICRLAQMGRAAGMHLVVATQRPTTDVITGLIKANIPSRIALSVMSQVDSRTIIDGAGADKLLGNGDMLYMPIGMPKPVRIQGCFASSKDIAATLEFIKSQVQSEYDNSIIDAVDNFVPQTKGSSHDNGDIPSEAVTDEDFVEKAIEVAVNNGQLSTSMLQRKLKLGYARAARIMDELEEMGVIGPSEGAKPRKVLMSKLQYDERKLRMEE